MGRYKTDLVKWGHHFFFGESILSNFHRHTFVYKGCWMGSSEQAYMLEKALYFNDQDRIQALSQGPLTPRESKKLGRKVTPLNADEWSAVSYEIMKDVLRVKFNNSTLRTYLENTKGLELVEASPYDKLWGIKIGIPELESSEELPAFNGQNLLGRALMEVRSEL